MADSIPSVQSVDTAPAGTIEEFKPLKAHFAKYKVLSGRTQKRLQRISGGSIVKRFEHTPYPEKPLDVICPHFLELKWGYGCPYDCAWCFLKGTLRMLPEKTAPKTKSREKVLRHVRSALIHTSKPEMFNTGELCDSLMDERNGGTPFYPGYQQYSDKTKICCHTNSKGTNETTHPAKSTGGYKRHAKTTVGKCCVKNQNT